MIFYEVESYIFMIGLGTIINAAGILAGGVVGLIAGKGIKPKMRESLTFVMGLSTLFIGGAGVLSEMLVYTDGAFSTRGTIVMIFSLVLGCIVGELCDIEAGCEKFGVFIRNKTGNGGDARFVNGFVTASLTVCVGAMAVIGSIKDGISGDYSILLTKSILDMLIIIIMTASLGIGCIFSAVPVVVFQGAMTLLARFIEPVMTETAVSNLSMVGSALIFCVGINLAFDKHIRVGNLLPSLFLR